VQSAIFKLVDFGSMPISDVKEMLDEADQDSFVDIEFPPVMSSICEINEPHPF